MSKKEKDKKAAKAAEVAKKDELKKETEKEKTQVAKETKEEDKKEITTEVKDDKSKVEETEKEKSPVAKETKEEDKKEITTEVKDEDKKEDKINDDDNLTDLGIENEELDFLDEDDEEDNEKDSKERVIRQVDVIDLSKDDIKKFNEKTDALKNNKDTEDDKKEEPVSETEIVIEENKKGPDQIDIRIIDERDKLDSKDPDSEDMERCIRIFETLNKLSSYDEFMKNIDKVKDTDVKDYLVKYFIFTNKITDVKNISEVIVELQTFTVMDLIKLLPEKYCDDFEFILQNEVGKNMDNTLIFTKLFEESDNVSILLDILFEMKNDYDPDDKIENMINHNALVNLTRYKQHYEYDPEEKEKFKEFGIDIEYRVC